MSGAKVFLKAGVMRKLYVDRKAAAKCQPPIAIKDNLTSGEWRAQHVTWQTGGDLEGLTIDFAWSHNTTDVPALWVETNFALEITL